MKKLKIGIVGCGAISNVHSASLTAICNEFDAEVTAFADVLPERREFMEERFPNARQYDLGMKLITDEKLDIVHICLPTYLHAKHAIAAMAHGMNVFIEKPVCLKRPEAKGLLEAEQRSGKKAMVGQVVRFFDEYRYLKDLYVSQRYGKLKSVFFQRLLGWPDTASWHMSWFGEPEKSGSVILDLHIHDVDFIRNLLGEPRAVNIVSDLAAGDQPTHIAAIYHYDNVMVFAEGGWGNAASYSFRMSYRANFEQGTLVYDSWHEPTVTLYGCDGEITHPQVPGAKRFSSVSGSAYIPGCGPYYEEIRYFVECVLADKPVEQASLKDAIKTYELTMTELEMAYAQAGVPFPIIDAGN